MPSLICLICCWSFSLSLTLVILELEIFLARSTHRQTDTKVVTDRKSTSMYMGGNKLPWKKTSDSKVLKSDSRNEFKVAKGANLKFEDEGAIAEAIADVRDDASSTQWCLASYSARDTLRFAGKGDGDVDEMLATCSDGVASYGFFRVTEQYDRSTQTRFVFVIWSPENLKPMERALMSTHKGAITPIFRPCVPLPFLLWTLLLSLSIRSLTHSFFTLPYALHKQTYAGTTKTST